LIRRRGEALRTTGAALSEELASEMIADVTTIDPVAFARAVAELPAGVFVFMARSMW